MNIKKKNPRSKGIAKVPVVMQLEELESGAAALTMILEFYGRWVSLEEIRLDCDVLRSGSDIPNIVKAAEYHGLKTQLFKGSFEELKDHAAFPCMIVCKNNHFVVLKGFYNNQAYINDPKEGSCMISISELDKQYDGPYLLLEPGSSFVRKGKQGSAFSFVKKRLRGTRSAIAFVVLTTIISSLVGIIDPAFSGVLYDNLLTRKSPEWFLPFIFILTGISIVRIVAEWIRSVYSLRIHGKLAAVGSSTYMWKVLRLPMEFFSQRMAGDIQQRERSNASVSDTLVNTLGPIILNATMMFFYMVAMIRYSWILTAIGMTSIVLNLLFSICIGRTKANYTRIYMRDNGKLAGATVAGIDMIESIKATAAENGYFEKWSGYQAGINSNHVKHALTNQIFWLIQTFITQAANIVILILGVWLVMQGEFTLGMVMAFQELMMGFLSPAEDLIHSGHELLEMQTQMGRIDDVMAYPTDDTINREDLEDEKYDKLSGLVEVKDISFGYAKLGEPLIQNFSMTLKPGSKVAIVGSSGCGKTTLAKLISGLYQPWSGEILFDKKPIQSIDRSVLTGSLAVVDQDIILFEDTIANNIRMWDKSIEDFEMIMAARDAHIHDQIMQREGGYQYKIIEGGRNFSGGQKQCLEIARVLAMDPTIIILDEATSALDAQTEAEVVKSIKDRGITCIVIAHRLSTIRDCDEIIVMDQGKIRERGKHQELMEQDGLYSRLVASE